VLCFLNLSEFRRTKSPWPRPGSSNFPRNRTVAVRCCTEPGSRGAEYPHRSKKRPSFRSWRSRTFRDYLRRAPPSLGGPARALMEPGSAVGMGWHRACGTMRSGFDNISAFRLRIDTRPGNGTIRNDRAETARYHQITTELTTRQNTARAALEGARRLQQILPLRYPPR
jgi:hypothetical protein